MPRAVPWLAVIGAILLAPVAQAADRNFKTALGVKIKLYDRTGTRMLRVSFQSGGYMDDYGLTQSFGEALKAIAEVARDQSSDVFAVTNIYCSGTTLFSTDYRGCAIEGAWLKPGETIVTAPKDNAPVYFSTAAALAGTIPGGWYKRINLHDGLTGKVDIVSSAGGPPSPILGADPTAKP